MEYEPATVDFYVQQIPFFANLKHNDYAQFATLMKHTRIIELEAGEVLIEKGTVGNIFYSLVHGQLAIFHNKRPTDTAIGELFPNEIFGALSVINQEPRTATVVVSSVEGATVFCTDYSVFGELDDFSVVSMNTKLTMFRDVVKHIHKMLKSYEQEVPDALLSEELSTVMEFRGTENSQEELEYLAELATALAWLLERWNAKIIPAIPMFDEAVIEARVSAMLNLGGRH